MAKIEDGMTPEAQEIISKIKKKEIRKMQKCIDGPEEMKVLVSESREVLGVVSFTSLSAVQIYDFHIFLTVYSSLHGFI